MDGREFSLIRHYLGKNQKQLGILLCISTKSIRSYEEGWRHISANAERQLLFLLALNKVSDKKVKPCWEIRDCPAEWRDKCTAWEFKAGHFCWFVIGTCCEGERLETWEEKIIICRKCKVFRSMIPTII